MKRLLWMLATILVITTLTFVMMKVIPGSPFNEERNTNEAVQRNLEAYYQLDEPLFVQYLYYVKSIVTFDFGPSIKQPSQSVNDLLSRGFPVSFELGMTALIVAVISGIALGIFAALAKRHHRLYSDDHCRTRHFGSQLYYGNLADTAICR